MGSVVGCFTAQVRDLTPVCRVSVTPVQVDRVPYMGLIMLIGPPEPTCK
jgi:hypothetical protein